MQRGTPCEASAPAGLYYLDAMRLAGPLADFDGADVRDRTDWRIGRLDGVVIDPAEQRVCYLVVDTDARPEQHRYLVPLDATQIDIEHRALYVHADLTCCEEFDEHRFRSFSVPSEASRRRHVLHGRS